MKEHIYTIPITEAFAEDDECPLCVCERKLEQEALSYMLGPAMMEPDHRVETNKTGFCQIHYEKMYKTGENRLAFALVVDTHMNEQLEHLKRLYDSAATDLVREAGKGFVDGAMDKLTGKKTSVDKYEAALSERLDAILGSCAICDRLEKTMGQFAGTVIYLYFKEPEFRRRVETGKGFCIKHFKLLVSSASNLGTAKRAHLLHTLSGLMLKELGRVKEDVDWFTKMFDYRNRDADWKNAKDALQRSICKLSGPADVMESGKKGTS